MDGTLISRVAGNTPVREVPPDYYPAGSEGWLSLSDGPDRDKKLFFFDQTIGEGEPERTVVFVHGNPESSYTWRHVIAHLRNTATEPLRIVAMDHIGFGLSDQATFEMVDAHHAANLIQLVRALDLHDVTLVVHDWGGPIGIGAFLEEPERVDKLVVVNSTVFPIPADGLTFNNYPMPAVFTWAATPRRVPDALWGAHAAFAIRAMPEDPLPLAGRWLGWQLKHLLRRRDDDPAASVWLQQFRSKMNVRSSKRQVRQTPVWGHGYSYLDPQRGEQNNRGFYRMIQQRLTAEWGPEARNIPVRGVWGDWDPLAKPSVLAQWRAALPQIADHIHVLPGLSHFVEEHEPVPIAEAVLR